MPERAVAETPATARVNDAGAEAGTKDAPIPKLVFPRDLPAVGEEAVLRDFFAPPGRQWPDERGPAADNGDGEADGGSAPGRLGRLEFVRRHRLQGVLVRTGLGIAVIDGVRLAQDDLLDACRLTSVSGRAAHFTCFDGEAVLIIATRTEQGHD